ncbi:hypothetical protein ZWY2020_055724 [Hordeum vulgare]|nr:hypothetical protein ZWY2020_055724 [Hordeum vulgare]
MQSGAGSAPARRTRSTAVLSSARLAVKKSKAEKDPNKPKRPPSAFFVFMDTFMKEYREKHPNVKQVFVVSVLVPLRASVSCCSFELVLL